MNKHKYINKDKIKNELIPLFSTPVVKTNIGREFTEDEIQLLLSDIPMERDETKHPNHRSKDYYLFDTFADKELKDIKKFCEQEIQKYLEEIEGADTDLATLRITQSWLNNTKPDENQHLHTHQNSYISGVLYFHCLPNDHINFNNRMNGAYQNINFTSKKLTAWNSNTVVINVKKGDLILFPSWIPHSVDVNKTKDKERLSLAFNTFPIGEMGAYNDPNHLKL